MKTRGYPIDTRVYIYLVWCFQRRESLRVRELFKRLNAFAFSFSSSFFLFPIFFFFFSTRTSSIEATIVAEKRGKMDGIWMVARTVREIYLQLPQRHLLRGIFWQGEKKRGDTPSSDFNLTESENFRLKSRNNRARTLIS